MSKVEYKERCETLTKYLSTAKNAVRVNHVVVGTGPSALVIAKMRESLDKAIWDYQGEGASDGTLYLGIPGRPDQFFGHGSALVGSSSDHLGLGDVFGSAFIKEMEKREPRENIPASKVTGESFGRALACARESVKMPIVECQVVAIEKKQQKTDWPEYCQDYPLRAKVQWQNGQEQYLYTKGIDLCLGAGPARHLCADEMSVQDQAAALEDAKISYLSEQGDRFIGPALAAKSKENPGKAIKIVLMGMTPITIRFINQLIRHRKQLGINAPIELTVLAYAKDFEQLSKTHNCADKATYDSFLAEAVSQEKTFIAIQGLMTRVRVVQSTRDFKASYKEGELHVSSATLSEERYDAAIFSIGQTVHPLQAQILEEFGSFSPRFYYDGKLCSVSQLPQSVLKHFLPEELTKMFPHQKNGATLHDLEEAPPPVATCAADSGVYCWGVAAQKGFGLREYQLDGVDPRVKAGNLIALAEFIFFKKACESLMMKEHAPSVDYVGSLAPAVGLLAKSYVQVVDSCSIELPKRFSGLLYYATQQELATNILKSLLFVENKEYEHLQLTNGLLREKHHMLYEKALQMADVLIEARSRLHTRSYLRTTWPDECVREYYDNNEEKVARFYEYLNGVYSEQVVQVKNALLTLRETQPASLDVRYNGTNFQFRKTISPLIEAGTFFAKVIAAGAYFSRSGTGNTMKLDSTSPFLSVMLPAVVAMAGKVAFEDDFKNRRYCQTLSGDAEPHPTNTTALRSIVKKQLVEQGLRDNSDSPSTSISFGTSVFTLMSRIYNLFLKSNDVVLTFLPCFGPFAIQVHNEFNAKLDGIELGRDTNFRATPEILSARLEAMLKDHCRDPSQFKLAKSFLFVNPVNPTGVLYTKKELQGLAAVFVAHNQKRQDLGLDPMIVFADDVFADLIRSDESIDSGFIGSYPDMDQYTVTFRSLGKVVYPGLRVAYASGPNWIMERLQEEYSMAVPMQEAAAAALKLDDAYYQEVNQQYSNNYDYIERKLRKLNDELNRKFNLNGEIFVKPLLKPQLGGNLLLTFPYFENNPCVTKNGKVLIGGLQLCTYFLMQKEVDMKFAPASAFGFKDNESQCRCPLTAPKYADEMIARLRIALGTLKPVSKVYDEYLAYADCAKKMKFSLFKLQMQQLNAMHADDFSAQCMVKQ